MSRFFQTLLDSNLGKSNQFFETTNSDLNLNFETKFDPNQARKQKLLCLVKQILVNL